MVDLIQALGEVRDVVSEGCGLGLVQFGEKLRAVVCLVAFSK